MFILVAGAGYFFYQVNYNDKEITLARNEIKALVEKDSSTSLVKSDTETINNDVSANQRALTYKSKEKNPSQPSPTEKEDIVHLQKTKPATASIAEYKSENRLYADSPYLKEARKGYGEAGKEYVLKGTVTDEAGNPVPYATIKNTIGNTQTFADESGQFAFKSQDSSVTAMASAAGYTPKSFNLKKDIQPTIEIKKNEASLSEVVVTGMGIRKQSKTTASVSKALDGKVAGVSVEQVSPQPSGGFNKFNQYLKENTPPVYDENSERLNGEVLLSFTIDKKGKPENIKVAKSSCAACEDEAIKLLRNGPKWIGKKNVQGTVVIQFNKE